MYKYIDVYKKKIYVYVYIYRDRYIHICIYVGVKEPTRKSVSGLPSKKASTLRLTMTSLAETETDLAQKLPRKWSSKLEAGHLWGVRDMEVSKKEVRLIDPQTLYDPFIGAPK